MWHTYDIFLRFISVMNVCVSISDVKLEVEQHVSLLFHKPTIFHTCTHDMEPSIYIYIRSTKLGLF